ncbi:MAG: M48 family metallopeptidase, partial [Deltaproteobacteria bacterium]|nr:M48 family metallopeptidase [Deltaproteobacteria bacterium]
FNAGVSQIPRLGIFGWHKNHLILGLPYMLLQSTEQFTAVLAHEYGHLSGSHGRFSAWIYRIRRTYFRILEALQIQDHWGSFLFKVFFNRYVPYFDAYSFVLARANEFEADKVSVEVTSSSAAAESLLLGTFGSRFLSEKFWKKINNNADTSPTPDVTPYLNMSSAFREHVSKEATDRWLKYARAEETESSDTHPALGQRLKAIGQEIRLVPVSPLSSATALLGDTLLSDLTKKLDLEWQENVRDAWQDRFDYATKSNARIVELEVLATSGSISDDNLFELASLTEEFRDIKTALSIYENVLENEATHAGANFAIGRIFLDKNDKEGLPYIEKAMVENPDNYLRSGAEWLYHFYKDNDNKEKAEKYYDIAIKSAEDEERIEAERNLYEDDELEPHGLSLEESENFLEQLKGFASLRSAFLATKKLELSPETPLYVLAVMRKWSGLRTKKSDSNFRQELIDVLTFPGECIVATLNDESGDLKSALKKAKIKPLYKKSLF